MEVNFIKNNLLEICESELSLARVAKRCENVSLLSTMTRIFRRKNTQRKWEQFSPGNEKSSEESGFYSCRFLLRKMDLNRNTSDVLYSLQC